MSRFRNATCHTQECNLSRSGMHQKVVYAYLSQRCSGASGLVTMSDGKSCDVNAASTP